MPTLSAPRDEMRRSFAEAMDEFRAEGRGSEHDRSAIGDYLRTRAEEWSSDEAFSQFVGSVRAEALEVDNIGSRTVIERNGGVLEDERAGKLRFWVPTG